MNARFAIIPLVCGGLLAVGISFAQEIAPKKSEEAPKEDDTFRVYPDSSGKPYFRKGSESYYTRYLAAMKEPSLFSRATDRPKVEFRFTWLRSFHDPIAIRIYEQGQDHMIRAIRLAHQQDYSPGRATLDVTRRLTDTEWKSIQGLLDMEFLLKAPTEAELLAGSGGMDGARWIYETCRGEQYQMLDFWALKDYGPDELKKMGLDITKIRDSKRLVKLSLQLLSVSGIKIPDEAVY